MEGPVDVTEDDPETYTSSNLAKFAWTEDPEHEHRGFLAVEFQNTGGYVYRDVPEDVFRDLYVRAYYPRKFSDSVGSYFSSRVKTAYNRKGVDYARIEDVLEEPGDHDLI